MRTTLDIDGDVLQAAKELAAATGIADICLLGLAKHAVGSLGTFDRTIPLGAVAGATRSTLLVIEPA